MDLIPLGDHLMKSVMERAAGRVVLTIVLIRGFCWGRDFVGLLRNRMPIYNELLAIATHLIKRPTISSFDVYSQTS